MALRKWKYVSKIMGSKTPPFLFSKPSVIADLATSDFCHKMSAEVLIHKFVQKPLVSGFSRNSKLPLSPSNLTVIPTGKIAFTPS